MTDFMEKVIELPHSLLIHHSVGLEMEVRDWAKKEEKRRKTQPPIFLKVLTGVYLKKASLHGTAI